MSANDPKETSATSVALTVSDPREVQSIHNIRICTTAIGIDCEATGGEMRKWHTRAGTRDATGITRVKAPAQAQLALLQFNWPILTGCGNTRPAKGRRETCFRSS